MILLGADDMADDFIADDFIENWRQRRLENYRNLPRDVQADSDTEKKVLNDGYDHRQVLELVQNGADAVLEEAEALSSETCARIQVLFDGTRLYVANTGAPLSKEGIEALLLFDSSPKRGNQIGRFGIGFKSLLRLGGTVEILSRGVSMQFDPPRCQREIRQFCNLPTEAAAPSFRLTWAINREAVTVEDPQLAALNWATTVVRAEVRNPVMIERIAAQIRDFPDRFLLFITSAVELTLEAPGLATRRISRTPPSDLVILRDGEESSRWRVTERLVPITDSAAREDAGDIHSRDAIPLSWAIPLDAGRDEAGRFWAFFPTQTPTRVPGILNAPWKLTSGRESITDGAWNRTLMREAAAMIAETLPTLADTSDPARALDYMPRQHDRNELAATLVNELWERAAAVAILPDATGALRVAADLRRHASDDKTLAEQWCEIADEARRSAWVHPDCLRGDRGARLRELAKRLADSPVPGKPGLAQAKPAKWFEEIAGTEMEQAKAVIRLAADYANSLRRDEWTRDPHSNVWWGSEYIRPTLKIVPDRDGTLRCPDDIWLARPNQSVPDRHFVADWLVSDPTIQQILRNTLEVRSLMEDDWLPILEQAITERIEYERKVYRSPYQDWSGFWETFRSARPVDQDRFAEKYKGQVRARRQDGTWQYPYAVLLPGEIVSATDADPENHRMLVDQEAHRDDEKLLRLLGFDCKPKGKQPFWSIEENFQDWTTIASKAFLKQNPRVESKNFLPKIDLPASSCLLPHLRGQARGRLTNLLLTDATEEGRVLTLSHRRRPDSFKKVEVEHPLRWLLRTYGYVAIGNTTLHLAAILARCDVPILDRLPELAPLLPTIRALAGSPRPQPTDPEVLDTFWQALADHLATRQAIIGDGLADLWRSAADDGWVPHRLPGSAGDLDISQVYVTGSADLARRARTRGWSVVELDEETRALWQRKGALDLDAQFSRGRDATIASFNCVSEVLPELVAVLSDEAKTQSYTQVVEGLHLCIGQTREPIPCLHWEGVLYLDQGLLEALAHRERLRLILTEAAAAGWLDRSPSEALARIADATLEERRRAVAAGADLAARLLAAVGDNESVLRAALGKAASRALPRDATPAQVAALTLDLLGPAVLQESNIATAMNEADLRPPARWGTDEARAYVAAIGFPESFAQSQSRRLDAEFLVAGPFPLPPLHQEYQVEVFEALTDLIESGSGRRRAVVSLPTGGGKTRVTVEAAVELILKPDGARRTVLWVAQTIELCEQAAQSFRQVWQNLGTEGETLRVIRFFGGHGNPAAPTDNQPTVVVASIQTLNSRFDASALAWLATPGLVVVDECHHAITPSYTSLLRWLNAEAPRPGTPPKDEPPLIGLSATPFRMDDEESRRLAKRFDQRQFPRDQRGLVERLLQGGFLARADYRELPSDATVSADLIDDLDSLWDSQDGVRFDGVLERVNQQLATNVARNERLIEAVQACDARQILFFANSVGHAEEMAARLCLLDIPAAAVSSDTPATARRWFLDRFKAGDLRVLCNHSVLTTGFDAPRTDLVLIARQVKSPVSYMQMVGRGLRGPRNGGTETCTILTVLDNLGRFRERHPFHYCKDLYQGVCAAVLESAPPQPAI